MMIRKSRATTGVALMGSVLFAIALPAAAEEAIKVTRSVPYLSDGVGAAQIRRECDWNTRLIAYLVEYADGDVAVTDEDLTKTSGRALLIHVTSLQAGGGQNYSRANWAQIRGVLKQGDRVIANFDARAGREVTHRATSCKELDRFAKQLAEVVAEWVEDPTSDARLGDWD